GSLFPRVAVFGRGRSSRAAFGVSRPSSFNRTTCGHPGLIKVRSSPRRRGPRSADRVSRSRVSLRSPGTRSRGFPLEFTPAKAGAGMSGVSIRLLSRQGSRTSTPAPSPQRLGEAELVTIWVGQVKDPLAPFGIAGRRVRAIAGRDHARMKRVDVGMVEDDASPPRPRSLGGLGDQIEIARSGPEARKGGVVAAVKHLKSQHAIEADRAPHVVGGERDGADAFDHRPSSNARGAITWLITWPLPWPWRQWSDGDDADRRACCAAARS